MTKEQAVKILKMDEDDYSFVWEDLGLKGTEDYNRAWNEAYDMAIKALEEKPCEDAISRTETLNKINELIAEYIPIMPIGWTLPLNIARTIIEMPSVIPKGVTITDFADRCRECGKTKHCKDCKHFEYDSVAKVDGIPLIVAHEICNRWGDGCKTKEDGYCFLFESKEESEVNADDRNKDIL